MVSIADRRTFVVLAPNLADRQLAVFMYDDQMRRFEPLGEMEVVCTAEFALEVDQFELVARAPVSLIGWREFLARLESRQRRLSAIREAADQFKADPSGVILEKLDALSRCRLAQYDAVALEQLGEIGDVGVELVGAELHRSASDGFRRSLDLSSAELDALCDTPPDNGTPTD